MATVGLVCLLPSFIFSPHMESLTVTMVTYCIFACLTQAMPFAVALPASHFTSREHKHIRRTHTHTSGRKTDSSWHGGRQDADALVSPVTPTCPSRLTWRHRAWIDPSAAGSRKAWGTRKFSRLVVV